MLGLIESDLHGQNSRVNRSLKLTTPEVHQNLHISGYHLLLPQSWYNHGQARVIAYIRDGIQAKERKLCLRDVDLPSISVELGHGREKKTCFNIQHSIESLLVVCLA